MNRERLHIEYCNNERQIAEAISFCDAYGHNFQANVRPTRLLRRGRTIIGIAQEFNYPVQMFGFHTDPRICTPRDFAEGVTAIRHAAEHVTVGGNSYLFFGNTTVPEEAVNKLGYTDTGYQLFMSVPPNPQTNRT